MRPTPRTLAALLAALSLALLVAAPSIAAANDVVDAAAFPGSIGPTQLSLASGHKVYAVELDAGDWVVAYSWAATEKPQPKANDVRVFPPGTASVDSGSAIATDAADGVTDGVTFAYATAPGIYYVDYRYTGPSPTAYIGMFTSRSSFAMRTAQSVATSYQAPVNVKASLSDELYTYLPHDPGPTLRNMDNCWLQYSYTGVQGSWKDVTAFDDRTDSSGFAAREVRPTVKTYYRWSFGGQFFTNAGIGPATSNYVVVTPRVALTKKQPSSAKHGAYFYVSGTIKPSKSNAKLVVQMRRKGSSKITSYAPSASGGTYKKKLRISTKGSWQFRTYFKGDTKNGANVTSWGTTVVK